MRYAEVEIASDAEHCYRLLCDIESVPRWLEAVADIQVIERDDQGRVTIARFISGHGSAGISYDLVYEYDEPHHTLRWRIRESTLRELEGEASLTPLGPDRCRLRYGIHSSTLSFRDGKLHLAEETPEQAAESFRRWAE